MIQEFQSFFVGPINHASLYFKGTVTPDNRWNDGILEDDDKGMFSVRNGIPNFVEQEKEAWTGGGGSSHPEIGWIKQSWNSHLDNLMKHKEHDYYNYAREIAESGGCGIDIASGPGGGAVPAILFFDPDARILMTDLGVSVLHLWNQHLDELKLYHNVAFAGMDVTNIPLRTGCLDYVVDAGGFGNVDYTDKSVKEAFRILKSGGRLYLNDAITEGLDGFPSEVHEDIIEKKPHDKVGWEQLVKDAGFSVQTMNRWTKRKIEVDESDLGALAKKYGVDVYFIGFSLIANKP